MKHLFTFFSIAIICSFVFFSSCKYKYVDDDLFVGKWELIGKSKFEGLQVEIKREKGRLKGYISQVPDNEALQVFLEENDVWLSGFERSSNYTFRITQRKVGADLFGLYGLETSAVYRVQFFNDNKFGISKSADPLKSKVYYQRVKEE